ncbi:oxidoreductase [Lepidopterella palustris CBS 459.81]|uniref:Oxidoreductase n=1 Tax=Lepidopterella palustris CBS 459.81 TaxID=1314670 RepID=A0A8E2E6X1_9PEZI|nr:oxidoreductase [Lepidopterella palustris CBS 459.81]
MDFPGVALVTGGASGIGKATALRFAAEGCKRIAIADVNLALLQKTESEISSTYPEVAVKAILLDVRSQASVQAAVDEVVATFGRIDYCANVAGILRFGDTVVLSASDFELVYQVNLRGVFFCAKAEISQMLKQEPLVSKDSPWPARGAIVNVSSQAGLMGNGDLPCYVATKHGVVGLSKSDGLKYAAKGIRVNALCPGTIETPILGDLPQGEAGAKRAAERTREIAMGRVGQPDEIAHCVMFLTSGRSSFVTATTLAAHGGLR